MSRRVLATTLLVAAACLTACSSGSSTASQTAFVAGDGSIVVIAPDDRQPAPRLAGPTLDGGTYDSDGHRGQVQVVNVWASWCAPCRKEAPDLAQVAKDEAARGVQFVGLNTRDSNTAARIFTERFGIDYPSIVDRDGQLQLLFRDSLPPEAIPSTVVIDAQGRVAARILGAASASSLRGVLDEVRKGSS